jgi:hypothetical protein
MVWLVCPMMKQEHAKFLSLQKRWELKTIVSEPSPNAIALVINMLKEYNIKSSNS